MFRSTRMRGRSVTTVSSTPRWPWPETRSIAIWPVRSTRPPIGNGASCCRSSCTPSGSGVPPHHPAVRPGQSVLPGPAGGAARPLVVSAHRSRQPDSLGRDPLRGRAGRQHHPQPDRRAGAAADRHRRPPAGTRAHLGGGDRARPGGPGARNQRPLRGRVLASHGKRAGRADLGGPAPGRAGHDRLRRADRPVDRDPLPSLRARRRTAQRGAAVLRSRQQGAGAGGRLADARLRYGVARRDPDRGDAGRSDRIPDRPPATTAAVVANRRFVRRVRGVPRLARLGGISLRRRPGPCCPSHWRSTASCRARAGDCCSWLSATWAS